AEGGPGTHRVWQWEGRNRNLAHYSGLGRGIGVDRLNGAGGASSGPSARGEGRFAPLLSALWSSRGRFLQFGRSSSGTLSDARGRGANHPRESVQCETYSRVRELRTPVGRPQIAGGQFECEGMVTCIEMTSLSTHRLGFTAFRHTCYLRSIAT